MPIEFRSREDAFFHSTFSLICFLIVLVHLEENAGDVVQSMAGTDSWQTLALEWPEAKGATRPFFTSSSLSF